MYGVFHVTYYIWQPQDKQVVLSVNERRRQCRIGYVIIVCGVGIIINQSEIFFRGSNDLLASLVIISRR